MASSLTGSFRILFLYDVCEEIRMEPLRRLIGGRLFTDSRASRHPSPEYIRFERPPVVHQLGTLDFDSGDRFEGEVDYYEYGVVSLKLTQSFDLDWPDLVALSARWISDPRMEAAALRVVQNCLQKATPALVKPNRDWLTEDYYIIHLDNTGADLRAADLIAHHGRDIARIVRGEHAELSEHERREILASQMSYYPEDLLVVGWIAAFVCDTPDGAAPTVQLLEYANTQLLEFRYYDALLSRVLEKVYHSLDRRGRVFARWRLASEAQSLNKIRLDVRELTERMDTSIKFLSDMFSARQYRMAAGKIGVEDYRRLVESKMNTAGDLYTFMMDQFHAGRGFVLELIVVVILVIELVFVFREQLLPHAG